MTQSLFDTSSACIAKGHDSTEFDNACIWILNHRCATKSLGGSNAKNYDFIDAFRSEMKAYFKIIGLDLLIDDKRLVAMLVKKAPANDQDSSARLRGYSLPGLEHDILLCGLYCLFSERESSLLAGRMDPKTGSSVIIAHDLHRAMDAQFARKIQAHKDKQALLWRAFDELGLSKPMPQADGRHLCGPAIELLITSQAFARALEDAAARASQNMPASPPPNPGAAIASPTPLPESTGAKT